MHRRFVNLYFLLVNLMFVCMFFSTSRISFAQIDSQDELSSTYVSDTERVSYYTKKSLDVMNYSLEKSLEYALRAKEIADSAGNAYLRAEALNRLGTVYYTYNHYQKAMRNFQESFSLRMSLNDSAGMAASLVNMGVLYHQMENYEKAIELTLRALELRKALGDNEKMGAILNNLFVYYTLRGEYQTAMDYGLKALKLYSKLNDGAGMSDIYVNMGELYYKQGNLKRAFDYYKKAKQHAENLHDPSRIININNSMITAYLDEKNFKSAGILIRENIPLAEKYEELEGLELLYEQIIRYNSLQGDFKNAVEYQLKLQAIQDSLKVRRQKDQILAQQARFEAELADQELRIIRQQKEYEELMTASNKKGILRASLLILFLFALSLVIYGFFRTYSSNEKMLKEKTDQLIATNKSLKESEEYLQQTITARDKFFSIIAHDIINPFQPLLGLSELLVTDLDKLSDQEIRKYSELIHQSASRIYRLLEDLFHWSRSQTDKLPYKPRFVSVNKIIQEELLNCKDQARQKKIKLIFEPEHSVDAYADPDLLKATLRNLLSNAIKFTPEKGNVKVQVKQSDNNIWISVIDNGVGIPESRIGNLFRVETLTTTKGTANEEGTGLGLLLCKEFVEKNHGTLKVNSEPGKGSAFHFSVPAGKR